MEPVDKRLFASTESRGAACGNCKERGITRVMDTKTFPKPALSALEKFPVVFNDQVIYAGPAGAAWAPGRINIIGEHTDYNDGFVLPAAVDRVAAFAGRMRHDQTVRL